MSNTKPPASARVVVPSCPSCHAQLDWLRDESSLAGKVTACKECHARFRVRGELVLHIYADSCATSDQLA